MRRAWVVIAMLMLGGGEARAQQGGLGLQLAQPLGDFKDAVNGGYGIYLKREFNFTLIGAAAEVNYVAFGAKAAGDDRAVAGFQAGPRLNLGLIRLGVDAGYFTNLKEAGIVPNATMKLGPLELGASFTTAGKNSWVAFRGGLRL